MGMVCCPVQQIDIPRHITRQSPLIHPLNNTDQVKSDRSTILYICDHNDINR